MKNFLKFVFVCGLSAGLLSACSGTDTIIRQEVANRLASPAWMVKREIEAGPFALTAYERMHERGEAANVYIEGNGETVVTSATMNPTPENPVALHLATHDKADNLVWLARPCQYSSTFSTDESCTAAHWGAEKFSPEIINAYNTALNDIKARYSIREFNLIGFDGGAVIAAMLADQRKDVVSLRSVAGTLDGSI